MNKEERQQFEQMQRDLADLKRESSQRKIQQISYPLDDVSRTIINRDTDGITSSNFVVLGSGSNLTIASGSVTPTQGFHDIDTEGAAASDDLDTIVNTGIDTGSLLLLRAVSSSRTVVLKDGTGNLALAGNFSLTDRDDTILLVRTSTGWSEVSRSDNAA